MTFLPALLLAASLVAPEDPDQQYAFIVGLARKGLHEMVIEEANAFLRDHPRHDKADLVRYRSAVSLFELGRREEAAPLFRAVARDGFRYEAEAAFRLGQCEMERKRFDQARAAFERVIALGADYLDLPARFSIAEAMFQKGDHEAALVGYREVLDREGAGEYERDARYGVAWSLFRLERFDEAAAAAARFLKRHPGDELASEVRFLQGEALLEAGRPRDALGAYARVREGPFLDAALRGRGFAYVELGESDAAARAFVELLEKVPDSRFAREARLQAAIQHIRAGDPEEALPLLADAQVGEDPEMLFWRAQAHARLGDAKRALLDIDRALAADPTADVRERLQVARGDALLDLGRTADAARAYGAARSDYALHAAAIANLNDGRNENALDLAEQLLDRFPDSRYRAAAHEIAGEALLDDDPREAARHLDQAVRLQGDAPERTRTLLRLGWALHLAGDPREAAFCFERAATSADAAVREEARYMLGRAQEAAGSTSAAVASWETYLRVEPAGAHRADVLLGLARLAPERAEACLGELVRDHPDHASAASARLQLATRLRDQGRREEAARAYAEILRRHPESEAAAAACYGLAWLQFEDGLFAEARKTLGSFPADAADPELSVAALELAVHAAARDGDAGEAKMAFERLRGANTDPDLLLQAARAAATALARSGQAHEADRLLSNWQRTRGAPPSVAIERAWLAIERGDAGAAEEHVLSAAEAGAAGDAATDLCEAAFFAGELLFDREDFSRASRLYALAADTDGSPVRDKALYKDGFARLRQDDLDGAEKRFSALCAAFPSSDLFGESLYLAGDCRFRLGRFEDATEPLERLLDEVPRHQVADKALFRLGVAYFRLERFEDAGRTLAELARRFPRFPALAEAELWRGRALAKRGQPRAARQALERVIASDEGVLAARARLELGRLLFDGGDTEKALAEFLKVAVLYASEDEVAEGLYLAGLCMEKLGDADKARAQYREIVQRYPQSPIAEEARKRLGGT